MIYLCAALVVAMALLMRAARTGDASGQPRVWARPAATLCAILALIVVLGNLLFAFPQQRLIIITGFFGTIMLCCVAVARHRDALWTRLAVFVASVLTVIAGVISAVVSKPEPEVMLHATRAEKMMQIEACGQGVGQYLARKSYRNIIVVAAGQAETKTARFTRGLRIGAEDAFQVVAVDLPPEEAGVGLAASIRNMRTQYPSCDLIVAMASVGPAVLDEVGGPKAPKFVMIELPYTRASEYVKRDDVIAVVTEHPHRPTERLTAEMELDLDALFRKSYLLLDAGNVNILSRVATH